jgi:hypothetical protein
MWAEEWKANREEWIQEAKMSKFERKTMFVCMYEKENLS